MANSGYKLKMSSAAIKSDNINNHEVTELSDVHRYVLIKNDDTNQNISQGNFEGSWDDGEEFKPDRDCHKKYMNISEINNDLFPRNYTKQKTVKSEMEEVSMDSGKPEIGLERYIDNDGAASLTLDSNIHSEYGENSNGFKCHQCGEDFPNLSDLQKHHAVHFGGEKHFCHESNEAFVSTELMKEHKKQHKVNLACDKCEKTFGTRNGYTNHLKNHLGEKVMNCTLCDAVFSQVGHLNRHMRTHTGEKPYQCKVCDAKFSQSGSLKHHMKLHSGEKHFKCVHCDASFSHSGHFNQHMRQHTGEKPYKCVQCGLSYSRSGSLKQHMRTHTGDMPYKCPLCKRGFTRSTILDKHVRTHTGEKPFKCDHCAKCFSRADRLKHHIKSHVQDGKV